MRAWEYQCKKIEVTDEQWRKIAKDTIWNLYLTALGSDAFGQREKSAAEKLANETDGQPLVIVFELISKYRRQLGAPGDWGYGTPEGKALQDLYCLRGFKTHVPEPDFDPILMGA